VGIGVDPYAEVLRVQEAPMGNDVPTMRTLANRADNLEEYADYFWNIGDIACELLGNAECAREVRSLLSFDNPKLAQTACNFLKSELQENCGAR
jgi:hypothetical protein